MFSFAVIYVIHWHPACSPIATWINSVLTDVWFSTKEMAIVFPSIQFDDFNFWMVWQSKIRKTEDQKPMTRCKKNALTKWQSKHSLFPILEIVMPGLKTKQNIGCLYYGHGTIQSLVLFRTWHYSRRVQSIGGLQSWEGRRWVIVALFGRRHVYDIYKKKSKGFDWMRGVSKKNHLRNNMKLKNYVNIVMHRKWTWRRRCAAFTLMRHIHSLEGGKGRRWKGAERILQVRENEYPSRHTRITKYNGQRCR